MSLYYSNDDEEVLLSSLQELCTKRRKKELLAKPTVNERKDVFFDILDFIKKKRRIVYGGYALHALITKKSNKDYIYTDLDFPDVEFYTPYFKEDIKELIDMLA